MQETHIRSLGPEDPLEEKNGNPLQYSCLKNPVDRSLVGCRSESDTTEWAQSTTEEYGTRDDTVISVEKASDKIQHPFTIKTLHELEIVPQPDKDHLWKTHS